MKTICSKCGGKIKYEKVLKKEIVRVEENSGCCLISLMLTILTCGLNLLVSYIASFKKKDKCVIRGTCQKCGKVYEFESYPDEEEIETGLCETCAYSDSLAENGWCDIAGDYVEEGCEKWRGREKRDQ